jgi:hypothetical protein
MPSSHHSTRQEENKGSAGSNRTASYGTTGMKTQWKARKTIKNKGKKETKESNLHIVQVAIKTVNLLHRLAKHRTNR